MEPEPSEQPKKPDWRRSVSNILSPVVSVKTPTGRVEKKVSPWRLVTYLALATALVGGVVYWATAARSPATVGEDEPLF